VTGRARCGGRGYRRPATATVPRRAGRPRVGCRTRPGLIGVRLPRPALLRGGLPSSGCALLGAAHHPAASESLAFWAFTLELATHVGTVRGSCSSGALSYPPEAPATPSLSPQGIRAPRTPWQIACPMWSSPILATKPVSADHQCRDHRRGCASRAGWWVTSEIGPVACPPVMRRGSHISKAVAPAIAVLSSAGPRCPRTSPQGRQPTRSTAGR
jgi:hypothetical protein